MPDYAPGVPMWIDVSSPDLEKSKAFYSGLFGWDAQTVPGEDTGGYTMFMLNGKMAGALGPTFSPDQPAAWATYFCTPDANATAEAVKAAGGSVAMGPMDVMGQGHMAVFTDPEGAYFSVWQPAIHQGAEAVNESNTWVWNELNTRKPGDARSFYEKVFPWTSVVRDMPGGSYTEFQVDGRSIAGGMDITNMAPPEVPPHWLVYFSVDDCDAAIAKTKELGGDVLAGPIDIDMGRFAVLKDSVGAAFAVIKFTGSM